MSLTAETDTTIGVQLTPAVAIGGWNIEFEMKTHFGGVSGIITKSVASGFNGASGITVTNSGEGLFNISIRAGDTSGLLYAPYAYTTRRDDSGFKTVLTEGFCNLVP